VPLLPYFLFASPKRNNHDLRLTNADESGIPDQQLNCERASDEKQEGHKIIAPKDEKITGLLFSKDGCARILSCRYKQTLFLW